MVVKEFLIGAGFMFAIAGAVLYGVWKWIEHEEKEWRRS